jgi:hypothetical protein
VRPEPVAESLVPEAHPVPSAGGDGACLPLAAAMLAALWGPPLHLSPVHQMSGGVRGENGVGPAPNAADAEPSPTEGGPDPGQKPAAKEGDEGSPPDNDPPLSLTNMEMDILRVLPPGKQLLGKEILRDIGLMKSKKHFNSRFRRILSQMVTKKLLANNRDRKGYFRGPKAPPWNVTPPVSPPGADVTCDAPTPDTGGVTSRATLTHLQYRLSRGTFSSSRTERGRGPCHRLPRPGRQRRSRPPFRLSK